MRQQRFQLCWWIVEQIRMNARGEDVSMELTEFSIWAVASFTPGDAVPIVEAHVCIDVINHSEAWHQSLCLLEQLPR